MSAPDILTTEPTAADAQRCAEYLVEAGVETFMGLTTERRSGWAQSGSVHSREVLVLAAEVVELRTRVAALEAERDDLLGTVDTLTAGLEAHAAGLSALSATIERACEEAAEPEPEVERAPCEECANCWRCAMEGMEDATQRDCAFPESRFEPIGGAA